MRATTFLSLMPLFHCSAHFILAHAVLPRARHWYGLVIDMRMNLETLLKIEGELWVNHSIQFHRGGDRADLSIEKRQWGWSENPEKGSWGLCRLFMVATGLFLFINETSESSWLK